MSEQDVERVLREDPAIREVDPSEADRVKPFSNVGILRSEDVKEYEADWMAFDPESLIHVLEEVHEDESVLIATGRKEMQSGVPAPIMLIGDTHGGPAKDMTVVTGQVGGDRARRHEKWRDENADGTEDGDSDD